MKQSLALTALVVRDWLLDQPSSVQRLASSVASVVNPGARTRFA